MEHHADFDRSPACPAPDADEPRPHPDPRRAHQGTKGLSGELPRMFALIRETYEDEGEEETVTGEVVAYGLALPGGTAATVGASGRGFGLWRSPHSAASRLRCDLAWLGQGGLRPGA